MAVNRAATVKGERGAAIGTWITAPCHWAIEMASAIGYDAVLIDLEHGTIHPESADRLIALGGSLGLEVLVRVASPDRVPIQQALDAGADAVILPQVRDLEHARSGAAFAKYPELGSRGMGTPRSLKYGATPTDFVVGENRRTRCLIMIETAGALRDVEEIVALPTVDGIFMGPYDLSLTRGRGQYRATADDRDDANRIAEATTRAGKFIGIPAGDADAISFARSLGASLISVGEDLSALNTGLQTAFDTAWQAAKK
jgi:2-keto-3-deoxy-L-rhamnonate aldolase RhmA